MKHFLLFSESKNYLWNEMEKDGLAHPTFFEFCLEWR